jgi:catechol 2,3-dioxygenase-like lactoylglutathione lyase family enzyme
MKGTALSPYINSAKSEQALASEGTMKEIGKIKVLFVAGFGPVVSDMAGARGFYKDLLNIPFKERGGYFHTDALEGVKEFALWPLSQAAQSCFGKETWPDDIPVPQAWLEFDVESVEDATAELEAQGYRLLIAGKKEPWGQTVTRLLGPEGLLVGITFTPWMRKSMDYTTWKLQQARESC